MPDITAVGSDPKFLPHTHTPVRLSFKDLGIAANGELQPLSPNLFVTYFNQPLTCVVTLALAISIKGIQNYPDPSIKKKKFDNT